MAFAAVNSTSEPRSYSTGPLKEQLLTYSVASGDTSGTVTCDALTTAMHIIIDGVCGAATAAPTFSGNVVTLAFADPVATRYGSIRVLGR